MQHLGPQCDCPNEVGMFAILIFELPTNWEILILVLSFCFSYFFKVVFYCYYLSKTILVAHIEMNKNRIFFK